MEANDGVGDVRIGTHVGVMVRGRLAKVPMMTKLMMEEVAMATMRS